MCKCCVTYLLTRKSSMQLHDLLHLHFTLLYILLFSLSLHHALVPICTPLFISHHPSSLYSSSSLPLLYSYSTLNPLSPPLFIFPYFCTPLILLPHSLSILHFTLHSYSSFLSLSLFHHLSCLPHSPSSLPTSPFLHCLDLHSSLSFYNFLPPGHFYSLSLTLRSPISLSSY